MEGTATTLNYLMDSRWYGRRTDCCSFSLFLTYEHVLRRALERYRIPIHLVDYRHCCDWLTVDYVQPEHQYDDGLRVVAMIKQYLQVTKPGIIFGNLISVMGSFLLASKRRD